MIKRGAGNIEFILSFILFISFTAAALYFFNPVRELKSGEASRDYVINTIIKNTSVDLDSYSIVINTADLSKKDFNVNIPGISSQKNAKVVDYYGAILDSKRGGENVCFTRNNGENFSTIYLSDDIDENNGACSGSTDYTLASSSSNRVISEKKVMQLREAYYANYSLLKKQLDVPEGFEFSFSLEFSNGENITVERSGPLRGEIFSNTKIKEVLRKRGTSQFGYLTVRVW